ncbi:MAG: methylmalonyl Co-A mutase-associated GTPase MeaB, partial [Acidimicrobiales bacterium]
GGAVLCDRVRMQAHATDPGVFVRSMASRAARGGLSPAAPDAVRVLDAAGWPEVLVETVGVGQSDVDVALVADTVVVVVTPGWGDGVQAEKAGVLEIADVVVVNKGDRPGADEARAVLATMGDLVPPRSGWRPPVVVTSAVDGSGVAQLWDAVGDHRAWLATDGRLGARRRARRLAELRWVVEARAGASGLRWCHGPLYDEAVAALADGRLDPGAAATTVLGAVADQ